MGDVISFGEEKRKRERTAKKPEISMALARTPHPGWPSIEDMLRSAADEVRDGKFFPEGACVMLYSENGTRLFRRGLSVDAVATIADNYWNAVANVFDPA